MIFVQIASYRDPELLPTILDCLEQAARPQDLRFGICWQHSADDHSLDEWKAHTQFRIDDVRAEDSLGCCWARARCQSLYNGEHFTLQLDGHHRFEPGWDTTLIEMFHQTGVARPIITTYGGSYDAEKGRHPCVPWKLKPKPFGKDGALVFVPTKIANHEELTKPIPARFLSGHFLFTLGRWNLDVPYDPSLYFIGEEISLSVRSFTHGYDLFHPHRIVIWHQYHRNGRAKQWEDHSEWTATDRVSKARVRKLLGMEDNNHDLTGFELGKNRTLADYERFAGIDFAGRRLHADCLDAVDPPCSDRDDWSINYSVLLHWASKSIELPEGCTHVDYYIDDARSIGMWHHKSGEAENFQAPVVAEFCSCREPAFLVIYPHTKDGPWSKKYSLPLLKQELYCPH